MNERNAGIIDEFRANDGKVGGGFQGAPLLILHTTGAKSGAERLAPLMYLNEDDRIFVFASKGGAHSHPDWFHNVKANPEVSVEMASATLNGTAVEVVGDERDGIYSRQSTTYPQFDRYQAGTDRKIPVVEIVVDA